MNHVVSSDPAPPLVIRLFGEHWDELERHPDCWNRWFGPDSDSEEEDEPTPEELAEMRKNAGKMLTDHKWIKQRLDEEVYRFVTEELKLKENNALSWRRAKFLLAACLVALLAQFPYFFPADSPMLRSLMWALICTFFVLFGIGQLLSFSVPWNAIMETCPTDYSKTNGLYIETDMPGYSLEYTVTVRSKNLRNICEKRVLHATGLFSPMAKLTPEPLQKELREIINAVHQRC